MHGEIFYFMGIPFAFQALPVDLWNAVLVKIAKKLDYWLTKPLSLVGKFQICSKVLAAMHLFYSSCWAPSEASYLKLVRLLHDFLWDFGFDHHGFYRVAWDFCCLPKEFGGLGLLSTQKQGLTLCAKWIIRTITGDEAWKVLV